MDEWSGTLELNHLGLLTLVGCPKVVAGDFTCSSNKLTSLVGGPKEVQGWYSCYGNKITGFDGAPEKVAISTGGKLDFSENKITSLHDIHKHIKEVHGTIYFYNNQIKSHLLGVLFIKGCTNLEIVASGDVGTRLGKAEKIINDYLSKPRGHKEVLECKFKLQDAGLDEFAQL
jgi:hypothetical protein